VRRVSTIAFNRRGIQIATYIDEKTYNAMRQYLLDLEKSNPGTRATISRYIMDLIRRDLISKGYLKE
jgi:PHD/YefM family antitoxin component YafN of YafNO toxin-antitoxin module